MTERSFISKGAASFPIEHEGGPTDIYFLLLPKVTMLALSAAVEPLRIANQVTNKELYRWFLLTEDGQEIRCSNGIAVVPDFGLINLPKSSLAFVVAGVEPADTTSPRILNWISRQRAFGCRIGGDLHRGVYPCQSRAPQEPGFYAALGKPTGLQRAFHRASPVKQPV